VPFGFLSGITVQLRRGFARTRPFLAQARCACGSLVREKLEI
jgi:hypothetical protein